MNSYDFKHHVAFCMLVFWCILGGHLLIHPHLKASPTQGIPFAWALRFCAFTATERKASTLEFHCHFSSRSFSCNQWHPTHTETIHCHWIIDKMYTKLINISKKTNRFQLLTFRDFDFSLKYNRYASVSSIAVHLLYASIPLIHFTFATLHLHRLERKHDKSQQSSRGNCGDWSDLYDMIKWPHHTKYIYSIRQYPSIRVCVCNSALQPNSSKGCNIVWF